MPRETLFFITPLGEAGSTERRRSDRLAAGLLEPVCRSLDIGVLRADGIAEPTALLTRLLRWVLEADFAVCDLAGGNPNVYYECGVRHCTGRPTVHLARPGEALPFDVRDHLTLFVDDGDEASLAAARDRLSQLLAESRRSPRQENPVTIAAGLSGGQFRFRTSRSPGEPVNRSVPVDAADWSGLWLTNFGRLLVRQRGTRLTGLFEHHSESWAGRFEGTADAEALWLSFPLRDSAYPGTARIDPRRTDSYALWFHSPDLASTTDLKAAWAADPRALRRRAKLWKLYGRVDASGELVVPEEAGTLTGGFLDFAVRDGTDPRGRTMTDLLSFSDADLDHDGEYLFWLFPDGGPEGSFPGLTVEDYAVLRRSDEYRLRVRRAFLMMLRFYGFQLRSGGGAPVVEKGPQFAVRAREWILVGHYHYSRITRILRFVCGFGLAEEARAWYHCLENLQRTEYRGSMRHILRSWKIAVGLDPLTSRRGKSFWRKLFT